MTGGFPARARLAMIAGTFRKGSQYLWPGPYTLCGTATHHSTLCRSHRHFTAFSAATLAFPYGSTGAVGMSSVNGARPCPYLAIDEVKTNRFTPALMLAASSATVEDKVFSYTTKGENTLRPSYGAAAQWYTTSTPSS